MTSTTEITSEQIIQHAKMMLADLEQNRLSVVLVPAPNPIHESHKIRAVESENPVWYRDLFDNAGYVRRKSIADALRRIIDGKPAGNHPRYHYEGLLREVIVKRLNEGCCAGADCPPNAHSEDLF